MKAMLSRALQKSPLLFDRVRQLYGWFARNRYVLHEPLEALSASFDGRVRFIQLGASDGLCNDPLRPLVVQNDWRGVLVEPIPESFEMLKRNYRRQSERLVFCNTAVAYPSAMCQTLYRYSKDFVLKQTGSSPLGLLQKTSFTPQHLRKWFPDLDLESEVETLIVPSTTVEMLAQKYFPDGFELLAMDLEGYESTVLMNLDFRLVRPAAIIFEADHLSCDSWDDVTRRLNSHGYAVSSFGGDGFALRSGGLENPGVCSTPHHAC